MSVNGYRVPSDYKNDAPKYTHGWKSPAFFTMHPGLAYVTHHRHLNAGERVRGSISQLVQSQPMVGPLMQGFRMITIATFTPDAIIYGWMRNGIRYTPQEWTKFDKWYFNPIFDGFDSDTDISITTPDRSIASSSDPLYNITAYYLQPGIRYNDSSPKSSGFYAAWLSPTFISETGLPGSENSFSAVGRGGLWDCLGVAPGSVIPRYSVSGSQESVSSWNFSVAPIASYFLSVYYYLANMQESNMFYSRGAYSLTCPDPADYGFNPSLSNLGFHQALCGIDPNEFIRFLAMLSNDTVSGNYAPGMNIASFRTSHSAFLTWLYMGFQAHGGLFAVPYRPDFFNNIIKVGDSPNVQIPVVEGTEEGGTGYAVAIPDLRFYNKIQNMMDRIFVGFGRFGDQLRTLMGVNSNPYTNKPDFLGIWQASLNPINTVAMAAGTNEDKESSTPGQMTARLDDATGFGGRSIDYYAKESGTVMFISFIVPMPAYSQGLHPDLASNTFADDFNPEYKGSGFQSVPRWRYSMLPSSFDPDSQWTTGRMTAGDPNVQVVGDTVAFDWLKTDYARLHGEFATGGYFDFWTLSRHFTDYWALVDTSGRVTDVSVGEYFGTYINPLSWQYVFQTQSLLDPNFFVGFNFDLKVTSSVPANYMPYIGR